mmetsp:Transcript_96310/g.249112  ORF Transcript_96310/g.249112 Transcript_96310/m.249112 type:complete len:530 (-) Transcript_96310:464-2053(-)|eukprot:CAMPEP_0195061986 /NCGR_PEP_ID=MMETSP0448-20130528/8720_1 /TAXON_ID=66468 /ORGANISM="Heterocapsa triquestra, Strain CCMP 448" /LENGTH=529 /DNA_ID=CAMNT_0040092611 /DNA_START=129 /DNA_END=1718 /DNA_ORIENTATION=+
MAETIAIGLFVPEAADTKLGEERWADIEEGCEPAENAQLDNEYRSTGKADDGAWLQHRDEEEEEDDELEDEAEGLLGTKQWSSPASQDLAAAEKSLASVGSRLHNAGRCKPCAFFHTKGCTSAAGCLFCHICPAHEKQRRKRLRRQICHNLLNSYESNNMRGDMLRAGEVPQRQVERPSKQMAAKPNAAASGHLRQRSDASTVSTVAPSPSETTRRSPDGSPGMLRNRSFLSGSHISGTEASTGRHSRQWSLSTQESGSPVAAVASAAPPAAEEEGVSPAAPPSAGDLPPWGMGGSFSSGVRKPLPPPPPLQAAPQQAALSPPPGVLRPPPPSAAWAPMAQPMLDGPVAWCPSPGGYSPEAAYAEEFWAAGPPANSTYSGQHMTFAQGDLAAGVQPSAVVAQSPCSPGGNVYGVAYCSPDASRDQYSSSPTAGMSIMPAAGYVSCGGVQYALVPVSAQSGAAMQPVPQPLYHGSSSPCAGGPPGTFRDAMNAQPGSPQACCAATGSTGAEQWSAGSTSQQMSVPTWWAA